MTEAQVARDAKQSPKPSGFMAVVHMPTPIVCWGIRPAYRAFVPLFCKRAVKNLWGYSVFSQSILPNHRRALLCFSPSRAAKPRLFSFCRVCPCVPHILIVSLSCGCVSTPYAGRRPTKYSIMWLSIVFWHPAISRISPFLAGSPAKICSYFIFLTGTLLVPVFLFPR